MIFLKFLKQQDWRYGVPCIVFFAFFTDHIDLRSFEFIRQHYLAWQFIAATGFLICYSFKFARKYSNQLIDQLKMAFYFLYFTTFLLYWEDRYMTTIIEYTFSCSIFYLYFYTVLLFYKKEMEEQGKNIRKSYLLFIVIVQSFLFIGMFIWAITQKVEAEKQKVLALRAKEEAEKQKLYTESARDNLKNIGRLAEREREEATKQRYETEKYKHLYDSLKLKK